MAKNAVIIFLLAMLVGIAVPGFAATPSADRGYELEEGNYLQDVFASEVVPIESKAEKQRMANVGPALLLAGIILLAASGRQYAKQHAFTRTELHEIRTGLETLIDKSVHIDGGQHEALHEKIETLQSKRQQIVTDLQQL